MTETKGRWSKLGAASAVTAVAGAGVMIFALNPASAEPPTPPSADKVAICHANNSDTNQYVVNYPDKSGDVSGHADHTGPVWNPTLKDQHIDWGDIIPPFDYGDNQHYDGLNWDAAGQAIFNNNCVVPEAPPTTEPPVTSEPPETSAGTEPTETVVIVPSSPGPIPEGVAAGAHSVSGTSVALGGLLMAIGVGGLLTVARPFKRGTH